jgi:hypothetical protein
MARAPKFPEFGGPKAPPGMEIVDVGSLYGVTSAKDLNNAHTPSGPQQQTVAGENSLIPIIYGRRRVGGRVAGAKITSTGALLLLVVWCVGEIDAVETVYINDAAVPAGVSVTNYTGTATQGTDASLVANYAGFTDTMRGVAYSVIVIPTSANISGFPRMTAVIRGLKVDVPDAAYVNLNGSSSYFATLSSTANSITTEDFSIRACLAPTLWAWAAHTQCIVSKWNATTNTRGWMLALNATGNLVLTISTNGTLVQTYTSSAAVGFSAAAMGWVRVEFDLTNGTNSTATFYTSADGITWTQLGTVQTGTIVASMFNTTQAVGIGASADSLNFYAGKVFVVYVTTPSKVAVDFLPWERLPGDSTWVASTGDTMAGQGGAVVNTLMSAWTEAPAAFVADLITNATYGMGKRVDFAYALAAYNYNREQITGTGGTEDRHKCGLSLDQSQPSTEWINVMRDYAHCWVVPEGDLYYLIPDKATTPVATFNTANIIEGSLEIDRREAMNQPTCVQVTYTDATMNPWRDVTISKFLPGVLGGSVPRRMSQVSKQGLTRYSEADRYSTERLNESTLCDTTIRFRADDTGALVRIGDIIEVTHPIGFAAVTGYPNGKPFRVLKSAPAGRGGRWDITALEYDPSQYSSAVVTAPSLVDTTLPSPANPPDVTGLTVAEALYQTKDGLYQSKITCTWSLPATFPTSFVQGYRVECFNGSIAGVKEFSFDTSDTTFVLPPLKELQLYAVRVTVISTVRATSPGVIATVTPQGKFLPPSDVPSMSGFEAGGRVFLSWGAAIDLSIDTIRYEIRYGATTNTWDTATRIDRVSALTWASPGFPTGTYRFFIKALDSVGNYSANAIFSDVTVSVDNAAFSAYSYIDQPVTHFASTEFTLQGSRYATTDWADGVEFGHATQLNTSGVFNDGAMGGTVFTQPHRSAQRFGTPYVSITNHANYAVGTVFTIEAWVFPFTTAGRGTVFGTRKTNPAGSWGLEVGQGNVLARTNSFSLTGNGVVFAEAVDNTIPSNKWSHICAVVNGTTAGACKLYINGVEVTYQQTNAYTCVNNTDAKYIGKGLDASPIQFNGLIVRTKFWNKALTVAQILTSMQYHNDPTAIGGMVGAWQGNDDTEGGTSTAYADSSTTANAGAIVGTPTGGRGTTCASTRLISARSSTAPSR